MKSRLNIWFVFAIVALNVVGLINLIGLRSDLVFQTVIFQLVGTGSFILMSKIKPQLLEQNYKIIYVAFTFLLFVTLFAGSIRGSRRWIDFGFFQFQTSEFFKPFFICCVAAILNGPNRFSKLKLSMLFMMFVVPAAAIFLQPDLGTVIIYTLTFLSIFYFSGIPSKFTITLGTISAALAPIGWLFLKDYQKARITGFLNPNFDPQGITYNITQAIIAIGAGGLLGKGLGLGTQARFRFLPEFHTDFAFASFIEQFGFVGGFILLALFALLLFQLMQKMFLLRQDNFSYLVLVGIICMIFFEVAINIGMNVGLVPVTGVALPFISYGGSSLLSTMLLLGIASAL